MKNMFLTVARKTTPWVALLVLQAAPGFAQTVGDDGSRMAGCQPGDAIRFSDSVTRRPLVAQAALGLHRQHGRLVPGHWRKPAAMSDAAVQAWP